MCRRGAAPSCVPSLKTAEGSCSTGEATGRAAAMRAEGLATGATNSLASTHCNTPKLAHYRLESLLILLEEVVELLVLVLQRLVLENQM